MKSTFTIRASGYLSVENAGATSQTKTLSGEIMGKFDLNSARSVVGRNVNLYLKDGSVIINVLITGVERKNHGKRVTVYYTTPN